MPQSSTQQDRNPGNKRANARQPAPQAVTEETEDQVYGLVSVLYHALQGAQACAQYVSDADSAGDEELSQFFSKSRDEQTERAKVAKRLLAARGDEDEDEDEDEDDNEA